MTNYYADKPILLEFWVKMAKMTLKVRINDHFFFQNQPRVSHDACLDLVIPAQICDEISCGQGIVYGRTDGQTDGRTDAGNDNTPSAWKGRG